MDDGEIIGAGVEALQARHGDLFRSVYALSSIIHRKFVIVPLDIVRQNTPSFRWQPMMFSQPRCGTKLSHLKLMKHDPLLAAHNST